jgi:hypothetical protein
MTVLLMCPAGTADLDTASYLASLVSEAEDLQLSGKGRAAEAATAQLAAVAAELAETGDRECLQQDVNDMSLHTSLNM